jgi:ABC-2 type transport system permease protein
MTALAAAPAGAPPRAYAPVPFGRLLRAEIRKVLDTRSARWLLAATFVISVAVGAIPVFVPGSIEQDLPDFVGMASTGFGLLLPVVVVLGVTTEWTQRTAMTTFVLEPRRGRVLQAKTVAALGLAVLATAATVVIAGAALAVSHGLGRDTDWASFDGGKAGGLLLSMVLGVLGALAFGFLLHNTAAAVVALFAVPTVTGILGSFLQDATRYVDIGRASTWVTEADWAGHAFPIVTSHLLWVAVPLALGVRRSLRRDIS